MGMNFPNAPSEGDLYQPAGGYIYAFSNGVWRIVVTPRICATGNPVGVTFPAVLLFNQDGTMTGTSTAVTSAYGNWYRESGRAAYSFATVSLKYDTNGVPIGSRQISQNVTIDEGGNSFTTTGTFQDYDNAGNPTISGLP